MEKNIHKGVYYPPYIKISKPNCSKTQMLQEFKVCRTRRDFTDWHNRHTPFFPNELIDSFVDKYMKTINED